MKVHHLKIVLLVLGTLNFCWNFKSSSVNINHNYWKYFPMLKSLKIVSLQMLCTRVRLTCMRCLSWHSLANAICWRVLWEKQAVAKKANTDSDLKYICLLIPFWLWQEYSTLDINRLIGSVQHILSCNKFLWMGIKAIMSPKITGPILYIDR